jgi:flagellar protein FliO/FliZ
MPEPPPPRPARPSFADEVRRPAPVHSERRNDRIDPLAGFNPEPMGGRPEPRPEPRSEPMPSRMTSRNEPMMPRPPQRPVEAPKPLPMRAPERAVVVPPPPPPAPAPIPMPPAQSAADQNLAEMAQRLEAALRRPAGDAAEPRVGAPPVAPEPPPSRPAPRIEPSITPPAAAPAPAKTGFENLEDEMASLLGRPKSPS